MNLETYNLAVKLRHELHKHPEISNHEVWTKKHLMDFLHEHTSLEIVDRGAWFYAKYSAANGNARKLAFRADFDALPIDETIELPYGSEIKGVSHKCGHDGHSASLAAFAIEIDRSGAENTIYFIFQHAEETGDGAKECSALILEEGIEEIYGYHNQPGYPIGEVIVNYGVFQCASEGMSMFFDGVTAHASDPEVGKNPAPVIARIISEIPSLHESSDYTGLILCTIIHVEIGAPTFGTAAGSGVLRVTLRGEHEAEMKRLEQKLDALASKLAEENSLAYHSELCDYFPECYNHPESVAKVRNACEKLGISVCAYPSVKRGSEDFGYYTKSARGAIFNIGAGDITPHHTVTYDFPDEIIPTAVNMFKKLAGAHRRAD
jgi:amidohydrolase